MNLLKNASFEEGRHHQDNIPEIVVPGDWYLYWIDNQVFPGAETVAYRPESGMLHINNVPPVEKSIFFLDGEYCWKIFKDGSPLYYAVTQVVSGLTPGARYRFNAQVYPDIVEGYEHGKKARPGDIWAAEARAGWSAPDTPWPRAEDGDVAWSKWFNVHNENFVFGAYNQVWVEFNAPASGEVRVWLECKAKWGFQNNWFMDAFSLELIGGAAQPPPPPVQHSRTYLLLPQAIGAEWLVAVAGVVMQRGWTVGTNPDDAGISNLGTQRVIAVNPASIGAGLTDAWYQQHHPGVQFIPVQAGTPAELAARLQGMT